MFWKIFLNKTGYGFGFGTGMGFSFWIFESVTKYDRRKRIR